MIYFSFVFFDLFLLILISILDIFLYDNIFLWEILIFFGFVYGFISSFRSYFLNPFQIYMLSAFLFSGSIPVLHLLGLYAFPENNLILLTDGIDYPIPDYYIVLAFKLFSFAIFGSIFGWNLSLKLCHKYGKNSLVVTSDFFLIPAFVIYVLFLLSCLNVYISSNSVGYIQAVHLRSNSSSSFLIYSLSSSLYLLVIAYFIVRVSSPVLFVRYSLMLLMPYFFLFLAGSRSSFLVFFMGLLVVFQFRYRLLSWYKVFLIFLLVFIMSVIKTQTRFGGDFDLSNLIADSISVFVGQGKSIAIISYTAMFLDDFTNSVYFIFGYIDGVFSLASNYTYDAILNKSYLSQHLIFILSPEKFYSGSTVGGSMVAEFAELYSLAAIPIYLSFSILIYLVVIFVRRSFNSVFSMYLYLLFFSYFFTVMRGSAFKVFNKESFLILILFGLLYFVRKVYKRSF